MTEAENRTPPEEGRPTTTTPEAKPQPKAPLGVFGLLMAKDGLQFALDHLVNAGKIIKASKVREAEGAEREVRVGVKRVRRALDIVTQVAARDTKSREPLKPQAVTTEDRKRAYWETKRAREK